MEHRGAAQHSSVWRLRGFEMDNVFGVGLHCGAAESQWHVRAFGPYREEITIMSAHWIAGLTG